MKLLIMQFSPVSCHFMLYTLQVSKITLATSRDINYISFNNSVLSLFQVSVTSQYSTFLELLMLASMVMYTRLVQIV
jgi:hypothetical protein